jgi:hypothetical protein
MILQGNWVTPLLGYLGILGAVAGSAALSAASPFGGTGFHFWASLALLVYETLALVPLVWPQKALELDDWLQKKFRGHSSLEEYRGRQLKTSFLTAVINALHVYLVRVLAVWLAASYFTQAVGLSYPGTIIGTAGWGHHILVASEFWGDLGAKLKEHFPYLVVGSISSTPYNVGWFLKSALAIVSHGMIFSALGQLFWLGQVHGMQKLQRAAEIGGGFDGGIPR